MIPIYILTTVLYQHLLKNSIHFVKFSVFLKISYQFRAKTKIIGRNQVEFNVVKLICESVIDRRTVKMAVITALYPCFGENRQHLFAILKRCHGRIMKKSDDFSAELFPGLDRKPKPPGLSEKNLFVRTAFVVEKPTPASANRKISETICIIEKNFNAA